MSGYDNEPEDKFRLTDEEVGSVNIKKSTGDAMASAVNDDEECFNSIAS